MSVEMQEAYIKDQTEMKSDGTYDYVDSKEFANTSVDEVKEEQVEQTASKKPPVKEEVVEASNTNFETPSEDNIDTSDFDI